MTGKWLLCPDRASFEARAKAFLMAREALNCVPLGVLMNVVGTPGQAPREALWVWDEGGRTAGVAMLIQPRPLILTDMPDAALAALVELLDARESLTGVLGPKRMADAFKSAWIKRAGVKVTSTMEQGVFETTKVVPPAGVPGRMRELTLSDAPVLADWLEAFTIECKLPEAVTTGEQKRLEATRRVQSGRFRFWEADGAPVAMAAFAGPTPTGVRVNAVYTPPAKRGKGYASALVAELTQALMGEGKERVFLFTDLANPTSNKIYQRIGYVRVGDSAHHAFG